MVHLSAFSDKIEVAPLNITRCSCRQRKQRKNFFKGMNQMGENEDPFKV